MCFPVMVLILLPFISVLMGLISGFQPLNIFFFVDHFFQPIVFLPYRWCTFSWSAQETIIFLFRTQKCSQQPLKQSELQRLLISIKATRWSCTGLWSQGWNSAARLTFHHQWAHYAVDLWASRLLLYLKKKKILNGHLILDEQSWWSGASGMSWQQRIKYKSNAPGGSGEGGGRWEGPGVSEEIGFFRSSRWCWPTRGGFKVRKWRHERRSSCWVAPIYSYQLASLLDRCHIKFCTLELPSEGFRRCSAVQNTSQSGPLEGKASKERVEFNKAFHLGAAVWW